jgi:hypothetical protein
MLDSISLPSRRGLRLGLGIGLCALCSPKDVATDSYAPANSTSLERWMESHLSKTVGKLHLVSRSRIAVWSIQPGCSYLGSIRYRSIPASGVPGRLVYSEHLEDQENR